jgi:hypothetical protein
MLPYLFGEANIGIHVVILASVKSLVAMPIVAPNVKQNPTESIVLLTKEGYLYHNQLC